MRLLASFIFFTRLPFWRIADVPARYFSRVVEYWPIVGWLTGAVLAGSFLLFSLFIPPLAAVVCAFVARMVVTGALHEDGLADFFDGLGGGRDRESVLRIMKDSHIGTYGTLALISYFLLAVSLCTSLNDPVIIATVLFCADTFSKFSASQLINHLPYARKIEEAKNKTIYQPIKPADAIIGFTAGAAPLLLFLASDPFLMLSAVAPAATTAAVIRLLRKRIGGYTGDCCGACDLLNETSFYLAAAIICQ